MKIALINAPYLIIYKKLNINQEASMPLGLLCVAGALESSGHDVKIFDPNLSGDAVDEFVNDLVAYNPDCVGITTVTPTFNAAQYIAKEIKTRLPEVPLIMGGAHVSALPKESLSVCKEVDYIVIGEGEETIVELISALAEGREVGDIPGIAYRHEGVCKTKARPFIKNLDSLAPPAYHLVPVQDYAASVVYRVNEKSVFIMSSRGCPASCTFCANNITGRTLRVYSIDYVLSLIKDIIERYGIRHFHFVDDNFMADQDRVREICQRIIDENLRITWFIFARTDHCQDVELLNLMKAAGCVYMQFGIESGNDYVLGQLGKRVTKDQMRKACRNCKKIGIDYFNSFMIGSPGDTHESVIETIRYARELDSIMAGFNILVPYPGTAIFRKYYAEEWSDNDDWEKWNHITHDVPIDYRHTALDKNEIDALRKKAIKSYYLRPRQMLRLLFFFKSPELFFKFISSSWKHLFYLFVKGRS